MEIDTRRIDFQMAIEMQSQALLSMIALLFSVHVPSTCGRDFFFLCGSMLTISTQQILTGYMQVKLSGAAGGTQ